MKIQSARRHGVTTTVHVTVDGKQFEYTSFNGGAWEVYDYPKSWRGVARFLGHLPAETGSKLEAILRRRVLLAG